MTVRTSRRGERGFALVAVLLVLAILGVVGSEFAYSMRLEASAVRAYKAALIGADLAEAGVEQAVREILGDVRFAVTCEDQPLKFYKADGTAVPALPRTDVPLPGGTFSYRLTDEEARLNVNVASPDRIDRLLLYSLALDKMTRDTISDSLQDWRDADELHRLNGAESDYYLTLEVPYRSHNANIESVRELLQIKGVTPDIFKKLEPLVSVRSAGQPNLNTASPDVLRAYGLSDAEISQITQTRCQGAYVNVPGQFGARGFGANTGTFRIEAEGKVNGHVGARITAIVRRRDTPGGPDVSFLEWSGAR